MSFAHMSRRRKRGPGRPARSRKLKVVWEYVPGPESEERFRKAVETLFMLFPEKEESPKTPQSRQPTLWE